MQFLYYLVLRVWVWVILCKRWLFPRGFRIVAVRRRCPKCRRRLRTRLMKRRLKIDETVVPICTRCARAALLKTRSRLYKKV